MFTLFSQDSGVIYLVLVCLGICCAVPFFFTGISAYLHVVGLLMNVALSESDVLTLPYGLRFAFTYLSLGSVVNLEVSHLLTPDNLVD